MVLTETHWNFLQAIAKAIRAGQLTKQNKNLQTYYLNIADNDGTTINKIDGFDELFWNGHQADLSITVAEFFDLLSAGYFRNARNEGNYYLNTDKILKGVDNYSAENTGDNVQPLFMQVSTAPQHQCDIFMVMPFREELDLVYQDHIKKVVSELNLDIKRGDDPFSRHDIITEIWSMINNCNLVIADCTGKNPNVFYELGLAHAIGKPVIVIAQKEEDVPFDIRHRRYIKYEYTPRGMQAFEEQLKNAIQKTLADS